MGTRVDLTGRQFGQLTVLGLDEAFEAVRNGRQIRWICKCECGTVKSIIGAELTRKTNSQKSCGCAAKQRAKNFGKTTFKDLSGEKFGMLTPIKVVGTNKYGYSIWNCKCDCGKEKQVTSRELLSGDTISCGCQKNGYRESMIGDILSKENIQYEREYRFKDLQDKGILRFDYALFNEAGLVCLIEHQGSQHEIDDDSTWHTESLERHDIMKKEYCTRNQIPLYEIWYNDNLEEKVYEILKKEGLTYRS